MLFTYTALDAQGNARKGEIDTVNVDAAISSLQSRGLLISSIHEANKGSFFSRRLTFFESVSSKELVILSRQIATLFEANVSALRVFRMLGEATVKPLLRDVLLAVSNDIQGGSSIADALGKHPKIFSEFYVNMVAAGEESGRLREVFLYLADYLDRTYAVASKARSALVYPAFVVVTFIGVMILLLTKVIPGMTAILTETGQQLPLYTRAVIGVSKFFTNYGLYMLILLVVGGILLWRSQKTEEGRLRLDTLKLAIPYVGHLFRMLYLSRLADNMHTMLISGIPMLRAIETTSSVVGNRVYQMILAECVEAVKGGTAVSDAFGRYQEMPVILVQMIRVGEETGELGKILKTLADFYRREVDNAVDALVSLIEPALIILLGGGVGIVVASVLIPIYNIATGIS
jgi:type IV pilus assembly protein PilC